mgnify:CR=1 FL=1
MQNFPDFLQKTSCQNNIVSPIWSEAFDFFPSQNDIFLHFMPFRDIFPLKSFVKFRQFCRKPLQYLLYKPFKIDYTNPNHDIMTLNNG